MIPPVRHHIHSFITTRSRGYSTTPMRMAKFMESLCRLFRPTPPCDKRKAPKVVFLPEDELERLATQNFNRIIKEISEKKEADTLHKKH